VGKHETGYERVERDYYPTPPWPVEALAEHIRFTGKRLWEPAAGDGRMSETLKALGAASVYSSDIEDRGYAGLDAVSDFLTASPPEKIDGITTNPPYGQDNKTAEQFVKRGLVHVTNSGGGLLILLLPSDFDAAKSRHDLFADCSNFVAKVVLTRRVRWFDPPPGEKKKSPKENHAWYIWSGKPRSRAPMILYAPMNRVAP
jgi:predicted RNA methylase